MIIKLQFLIKTRFKHLQLYFFSSVFGHQKLGTGLDPDSLELLDPYPDAMNPDPQPCFLLTACMPKNYYHNLLFSDKKSYKTSQRIQLQH
jgi:hypothetical protein